MPCSGVLQLHVLHGQAASYGERIEACLAWSLYLWYVWFQFLMKLSNPNNDLIGVTGTHSEWPEIVITITAMIIRHQNLLLALSLKLSNHGQLQIKWVYAWWRPQGALGIVAANASPQTMKWFINGLKLLQCCRSACKHCMEQIQYWMSACEVQIVQTGFLHEAKCSLIVVRLVRQVQHEMLWKRQQAPLRHRVQWL